MVTFGVLARMGMKVRGKEASSVFNRYHIVILLTSKK
jgi:hypothetical protein